MKAYMVHKGKRALITFNKREATNIAKEYDAKVREMPYSLYKDAGTWDYPTFFIQSEEV